MQRRITPIPCKPWTLNGLSDRLIVSHYENNYGAAVRSVNSIQSRLAQLDPTSAPVYEMRRWRSRVGRERDSPDFLLTLSTVSQ